MMLMIPFFAFVMWVFTLSGTTYAPGFSEERFASLRTGMTKAEVETLLGKPLGISRREGREIWEYTERRFGGNYEQRWAEFLEDKLIGARKWYDTD